jgi:hypothetical protein
MKLKAPRKVSPCAPQVFRQANAVGADPYEAVRETLEREPYHEVIVSTLPQRVSRWLHLDLAHRIARLGVPVSVVTAEQAERSLAQRAGAG